MSGASALAAAKRRRAVPAEPVRSTSAPSKPNQLPKPGPPSVSTNGPQQGQSQNPLQLLIQHEQRLMDLEKNVTQLKITDKKPETLTPDTLQFFKTQHEQMTQEIQDLKKILIKVQTFSMETNLDLIKIKKTLKMIDSNETA